MKVVFLITSTPNCEPIWKSLKLVGNEVVPIIYDTSDNYYKLLCQIAQETPDVICYLGAHPTYHKGTVPPVDILQHIKEIAPLIHICGDASDAPWHSLLETY